MDMHKNARLTSRGRERIVKLAASEQTPKAIGQAVGVCPRTVGESQSENGRIGCRGLCSGRSRFPS